MELVITVFVLLVGASAYFWLQDRKKVTIKKEVPKWMVFAKIITADNVGDDVKVTGRVDGVPFVYEGHIQTLFAWKGFYMYAWENKSTYNTFPIKQSGSKFVKFEDIEDLEIIEDP